MHSAKHSSIIPPDIRHCQMPKYDDLTCLIHVRLVKGFMMTVKTDYDDGREKSYFSERLYCMIHPTRHNSIALLDQWYSGIPKSDGLLCPINIRMVKDLMIFLTTVEWILWYIYKNLLNYSSISVSFCGAQIWCPITSHTYFLDKDLVNLLVK